MALTEKQRLHRYEGAQRRRRKRIANGKRVHRFAGQGGRVKHGPAIPVKLPTPAFTGGHDRRPDKGKGFFSKLKLSRWLRRTP